MRTTQSLLMLWAFVAVLLFTAFTAIAALPMAPMTPYEAPQRDASPNNVRSEIVQVVGDSITFEVQWAPPPRGRLQAPVTGYEVEIVAESAAGAGRIAGSETVDADARLARVTVYHDCADERDRYHARVRATGSFSAAAPWGTSTPVVIACDNTPPGAPEVQADTLPIDTISGEPDEVTTTIQPLASWTTVTEGGFQVASLGEAARICTYTVRDGVRRRAGWATGMGMGIHQSSDDGTSVVFSPVEGEHACWDVTVPMQGG